MKKVRLNENDIENLVKKIIKEDDWIEQGGEPIDSGSSMAHQLYTYLKSDHKTISPSDDEFPWEIYVRDVKNMYLNPTESNLDERLGDGIFYWLYSKGVHTPEDMKYMIERALMMGGTNPLN